jgi:V8-like Glu-specific endopeptidase
MKLLFSLALAVASTVYAPSTLAFEEGYIPTARFRSGGFPIPTSPSASNPKAAYDRAVQASIRLFDSGSECSGSVISPDGYVITALHCVQQCISDQKLGAELEFPTFEGRIFSAIAKPLANNRCEGAQITVEDGSQNSKTYQAIRLVALGRGFTEFNDLKVMSASSAEVKKIAESDLDYVVLKIEDLNRDRLGCIPTAKKADAVGSRVWSIGFPGANSGRAGGLSSDGRSELVSYGRRLQDVSQNEFFRASNLTPEHRARLMAMYLSPGLLVSNMDIYSGESGSMVLNSQGQLQGVTTSVALPGEGNTNADKYIQGSGLAIDIQAIRQDLRAKHGSALEKQIFNCPL